MTGSAVRLFDAGNRGIYPGHAVASLERMSRTLTVDVDEWGEIHVVRLRGELDFSTASAVHDRIRSMSCSTVHIDLSALTFCDARGLSALVSAKQQRGDDGCHVTIAGARGIVRRLFDVTGLAHELDD